MYLLKIALSVFMKTERANMIFRKDKNYETLYKICSNVYMFDHYCTIYFSLWWKQSNTTYIPIFSNK